MAQPKFWYINEKIDYLLGRDLEVTSQLDSLQETVDNLPSPGGATNTLEDYVSSFESDGRIYSGYLLNTNPIITRTINGVLETAQGVTNLTTDWANRLSLTYT